MWTGIVRAMKSKRPLGQCTGVSPLAERWRGGGNGLSLTNRDFAMILKKNLSAPKEIAHCYTNVPFADLKDTEKQLARGIDTIFLDKGTFSFLLGENLSTL